MNSTHIQIRAFIPYVVLGAGLIIVVSFLAPPSATQHSLERVISIANERSQNAQPAAGAKVLRSFAPQGPLLDAAPTVAKKALDGGQETPSVMWQTAIASEGDAATRLSPAEQPNLACTAWLEGWADPAKHEGQLEWILGFVTGSNYRSEGQGRPENADEVEIFIEHYCRNYPEHQLFMAAAALVQESGGPAALHEFKLTPLSQPSKSDTTKTGVASADGDEEPAVASDVSGAPATCKSYFPHVGVTITVPCD